MTKSPKMVTEEKSCNKGSINFHTAFSVFLNGLYKKISLHILENFDIVPTVFLQGLLIAVLLIYLHNI